MAARAFGLQSPGKRLAEGPACCRHLGVGLLGRHLERDIERGVLRQEHQEVVEHGDSGLDRRSSRSVDVDPRLQPAFLSRVPGQRHPSKQGTAVSSAHRYGFWRFRGPSAAR